MIQSLHIEHYALIDRLDICWHPDFSVITGETGAGKSIILGAIGLLLGERAKGRSQLAMGISKMRIARSEGMKAERKHCGARGAGMKAEWKHCGARSEGMKAVWKHCGARSEGMKAVWKHCGARGAGMKAVWKHCGARSEGMKAE